MNCCVRILFFFCCVVPMGRFAFLCGELVYVDFDVSMQIERYANALVPEKADKRMRISCTDLLSFFKTLYNKNSFLQIKPADKARIPKIIHQIWIGKKVPEKFVAFQKGWQQQHPDWHYILWTQNDISSFGFFNSALIRASHNPGEISDIMRYEILYRFGGVYLDFDFECLQPLDELNKLYDFYVGIQPLDSGLVQLGIGLIGSTPGHPILKHAIDNMATNWQRLENKRDPPQKTGPIYFTRSFFACAGKGKEIDIALPAHYFYPLGCREYTLEPTKWKREGAFGIHHWAGSWLRPSFRRPAFRDLH